MAQKRLPTQILLRYDTYTRWMNSEVILKPGEMAIAVMSHLPKENPYDLSPVGIKVGDGLSYFDELPWVQAAAADVYSWAKESEKPHYEATEIIGLADYINSVISSGGGSGVSGSDYRLTWDSNLQRYILQYYDATTQTWINTTSIIDLNSIYNRINTIERWANGAQTQLGNIQDPLIYLIADGVLEELDRINVEDEAIAGSYVTAVNQEGGLIQVTRSPINMSTITTGQLSVDHGGTGLATIPEDSVLIGNSTDPLITKPLVTEIENNRNSIPTTGAIIDYVTTATAALENTMHYIGEATVEIPITNNSRVNPSIAGYNFNNAQPGDVVTYDAKEFMWTGGEWRLLGDEENYAVKGEITDADINENAAIAQYKINGLEDDLENKVDKEEGKQLSSNDYTDEEQQKLQSIESGAQVNIIEHIFVNSEEQEPRTIDGEPKSINLQIPVLTEDILSRISVADENVIEHIFVNGAEVLPTTIDQQPKSVNIAFVLTQQEKTKLQNIQEYAQVNSIESLLVNNTEYFPNNEKQVVFNLLAGAKYLDNGIYNNISIDNYSLVLSKVAATGDIDDLIQTNNTYVLIDCGTSTTVI